MPRPRKPIRNNGSERAKEGAADDTADGAADFVIFLVPTEFVSLNGPSAPKIFYQMQILIFSSLLQRKVVG